MNTVRIHGKRCGAGPIHDFHTDYPRRIEVTPRVKMRTASGADVGLNSCNHCRQKYRIWMTDDATWEKLPLELHNTQLCVPCFKSLVPER